MQRWLLSPGVKRPGLLLLSLTLLCLSHCASGQPNIILVLLDDAGWADYQSNDPLMVTPNIERLRQEGLFLNQSYVLPMCAPTRSALLTGRYPHTFGLQHGKAVGVARIAWLNETLTLLPAQMKLLGYRTHMLGKWHLGHCHPSLNPIHRGFDTYYGMLLGGHDNYFLHEKRSGSGPYDWWDGDRLDLSAKGKYKTDLLNNRTLEIIRESDPAQPFFIYLSHYASHGPLEAPQSYVDRYCLHHTNASRRTRCAMIAAVDEGVGDIVALLKEKGIYDNTVIVVMSDNGGPIDEMAASNYPLRSGKKSVYEGGTRSYTVLKAPGLAVTGNTWPGLIHAIDWMPTFVAMGGGSEKDWMHGENIWDAIRTFGSSPRTEFLYTYDDYKYNHTALRFNEWKLIKGKPGITSAGWYPPYNLVEDGTAVVEEAGKRYKDGDLQLYNIEKDPTERNNLAEENPGVLQMMVEKLEAFLVQFPLQPFVKPEETKVFKHKKNKTLNACFCHPPGAPDFPSCPTP